MVSSATLIAVLVLIAALSVVLLGLRERAKSRVSPGRIVFIKGPREGDEVALSAGRIRIGALDDNDLVIPSRQVSRYHAELRVRAGRVHLWDLQARNLTYVNGETVQTRELESGDVITIGDAELRYER
jgi:pSer/pThr/pTyr-binding forkhead associated (FHA) protein